MAAKTLITVEQFRDMAEDDAHRFELVHGELIEMASPTLRHNRIRGNVARALIPPVEGTLRGIVAEEVDVRLGDDTVRRPDVIVLTADQVARLESQEQYPVPFAPALAIEVLSPNDKFQAVLEKALEYLAAGTTLVWIFVARPLREVHVLDGVTHRVVSQDEFLEAPEIIPGFHVRAGDLFQT